MTSSKPAARILVIDHTAELSGAEVALTRLLDAIDRKRFDVRVLLLTEGPLAGRLRSQGIRVGVLAASRTLTAVGRAEAASSPLAVLRNAIRTLSLVPRVTAAIRGSHADLVVANTLKSAVLTSVSAPLSGRRWLWLLHDRIAPDYLPRALVIGMRTLARWAPSLIVANSRATRATLSNVPDSRVVVAYPGVDVSAPAPARTPSSPPRFGLLGRIAPTKGQLEFLQAVAILVEEGDDIRFSVMGDALFNDGPFADDIRAMAEATGIACSITFTGWLRDPTPALTQLTALVHASPVAEPFGQVIVEAMLAGVPVIATDAGGAREILDVGGTVDAIGPGARRTPIGLLVAPGDPLALAIAMRWAIDHPADLDHMADGARQSALERFDVRIAARIVEGACTRALGSRRGRLRRSPADIVETHHGDEQVERT